MKSSVSIALLIALGCISTRGGEIHEAVKTGNVERAQTLLRSNAQLANTLDASGYTPLHWAFMYEQQAVAETLLIHHADANAEDADGYTPLRWTILRGRADLLKLLLKHNADPNAKDKNGYTPLHWAAMHGQKEIAALLLSKNAKVNARDKSGQTPLHYAQDPELTALLKQHGAKSKPHRDNIRASEDFLHAIATGDEEKVKAFLLTNPVLANAMQESLNRWTVLHEAATEGRVTIVAILLANHADPDVTNATGETPLHWATRKGHVEIVKLLLSHQADPNAKEDKDRTPLHEAAFRGNKEIVELLIAAKADVNVKDKAGKAALFYALDNEHKEVAKLLRQHGAKE